MSLKAEANNRRQFLKLGATTAVGAMTLQPSISRALASACGVTPEQTPGPFYPGEGAFHPDQDLTQVAGHAARAKGQVVYVRGQVIGGPSCAPIAGATVEIWQACATGRYNNPKDDNPAPIDPDFKYWGEAYTDAKGAYMFKTILPGAYPADTDWTRPPHIHFKVSKLGYKELITQMYFKGNQWNDRDLILKAIPAHERNSVIVDFQPSPADLEPGSLLGKFDISLQKVR